MKQRMNGREICLCGWIGIFLASYSSGDVVTDRQVTACPAIFPDYTAVTFPPNIAPPNCRIEEPGDRFRIEVGGGDTRYLERESKDPQLVIPEKTWKKLAQERKGKDFYIRVWIRKQDEWIRYADIRNTISTEPIDPYLVYRLLYPGYEMWNRMGIYRRNLETYEEIPVVENRTERGQCMNCHTFCRNDPQTMMYHIRGKGNGTCIYRSGTMRKVEVRLPGLKNGGTYAAWHPGGRYIAFSVNEIQQFFHAAGKKPVEVADLASDLILWDCEEERAWSDTLISGPRWMETFPTWSPDGKTLYYCRAEAWTEQTPLDSIRYDLYRASFDAATKSFGNPEAVCRASAMGKSISFPRVSPDGRYLMFVCSDYGNFSIWHPESELWLMDLHDGNRRELREVNSDNVDSFHTWSASGRWFVFSSKRIDGLWAHPYIASFDPISGRAGKPFLVPQRDPLFYRTFMRTFNLPELVINPLDINKMRK